MYIGSGPTILQPNPRNQNARILAAAQRLYAMGFSLVPLVGDTKVAAIKWKTCQTERLPWPELRDHLVRIRGNYSVLTGSLSNLVVVEADDAEALKLLHDRLPPTPMRQRSRKGEHWLFRHPGFSVANRVRVSVGGRAYALDLRGDGGYIVGPCCVHASGHIYEEVEPWTAEALARTPIFDPTWIDEPRPHRTRAPAACSKTSVEDIPADSKIRKAKRWLLNGWDGKPVPGTRKGDRASDRCLWVACRLSHGYGLTPDEALPLMAEWGQRSDQLDDDGNWCPWTESELMHKLTDADGMQDREGRARGYAIRMVPTMEEVERFNALYRRRRGQ